MPESNEQPAPTPNDRPAIGDLVIADIRARMDVGASGTGFRFQAFNGRDSLRDAYDKAIDLTKYIRQKIAERDERDAVYEAMREALKPLADMWAAVYGKERMPRNHILFGFNNATITFGQAEKAAAALARAAELERSWS